MRTKARSRGFSMIEMVIVVSITMIVAAVIFSWGKWRNRKIFKY